MNLHLFQWDTSNVKVRGLDFVSRLECRKPDELLIYLSILFFIMFNLMMFNLGKMLVILCQLSKFANISALLTKSIKQYIVSSIM